MINNLNAHTVNWNCPSIENRAPLPSLTQETIASFTNIDAVKKIMEHTMRTSAKSHYILPVWQNIESIALGTHILNENRYFTPSEYCIEALEDIKGIDFDFSCDSLIQTVVKTIPYYKDKPLILEIEAPFSILAALMNPLNLYLYFEDNPILLTEILHKIADASAKYIQNCIAAGCRIFSLADPVGTLNLIGEKYYTSICGRAEIYLMKKCIPFLNHAVIHICQKMSQSLVIADLAKAELYKLPQSTKDYIEALLYMADNPAISFTGMTCIHNSKPNLTNSYTLYIK